MTITFTVNSLPVAQPRQRHSIRGVGKNARVVNYTPANDPVNSFKYEVKSELRKVYQGPVIDEAIMLRLVLIFPRNKTQIWKNKSMPRIPKTTKPDFDNLAKSVCDALNGLLYRDDSLIYAASVIKWIASGDELPRAIITIDTLNQ